MQTRAFFLLSILASPALSYLLVRPHENREATVVSARGLLGQVSLQETTSFPGVEYLSRVSPEANRRPYSRQFATEDSAGIRIYPVNETVCKSGSHQITGHVNVTAHKSLFFWFHESRRDPENDPVIIWLNGGPGSSSLMGALAELGPCLIDDDGKNTSSNVHSWSNFANIVFVDQPAGVGFSTVTNDTFLPYLMEDVATDFSTFIRRLFKHVLPDFAGNKVHLMGESFAGIYLPGILAKIVEQQSRLRELGQTDPFPAIESLVLADGLVDWATNYVGLYRTTCIDRPDETGVDGPVLNETDCQLISAQTSDCEMLGAECRTTMHGPTCESASKLCDKMGESFWKLAERGERSPYDMRAKCPDFEQTCLGYFENKMKKYLNKPQTIKLLGLPEETVYEPFNWKVNLRFERWGYDEYLPTMGQISRILDETNIRVLIYNGNSDWIINTPGVLEWMNILPWSGNGEFRATDLEAWWYVDDYDSVQKGGMTKAAKWGKLRFASVDEAGHLAPYDQPAAMEELIKSWLEEKSHHL